MVAVNFQAGPGHPGLFYYYPWGLLVSSWLYWAAGHMGHAETK